MTQGALRVIAFLSDRVAAKTVSAVVGEDGDSVDVFTSVDEVVARASANGFDVAFVDVDADDGAALALCHHLPILSPGVEVHVLVSPRQMERGASALSLGAAGVIVSPPTGDAIARVLSHRKATNARTDHVQRLEHRVALNQRRLEAYDRVIRRVRGASRDELIQATVEGVLDRTHATGAALYLGGVDLQKRRAAATGTAKDLPSFASSAELLDLTPRRDVRVLSVECGSRELGILVIDGAGAVAESDLGGALDLVVAMLLIAETRESNAKVAPFAAREFRSTVDRMLKLAGRHGRRGSVLVVLRPPRKSPEDVTLAMSELVRSSDALCAEEDGAVVLFLPETSGIGAHACRRRVLSGLTGERRGRPSGSTPVLSSDLPRDSTLLAAGIATFPHDGATFDALARAARSRALDDRRSAVHMLGLETMLLGEVVDALIARPMLDAGPRSPFPLDIPSSALSTLVSRACCEAQRGGETALLTTFQPGLGVAAAARQVGTPRIVDVRAEADCGNIEAIVVEAEHSSWVCCGRVMDERFRGVHCADPLLSDILARRLVAVGAACDG